MPFHRLGAARRRSRCRGDRAGEQAQRAAGLGVPHFFRREGAASSAGAGAFETIDGCGGGTITGTIPQGQTITVQGATQNCSGNTGQTSQLGLGTATSQTVGVDAYQQCVNGIKGPEYVHFRQTGQMTAFTGAPLAASSAAAPAPGPAPVAAVAPAPMPTKSPVQDEGDGKHFVLTAPGQTDAREVTLVPGSKNSYIEDATGDKYIVMPDGSVNRIPHVKKTATK